MRRTGALCLFSHWSCAEIQALGSFLRRGVGLCSRRYLFHHRKPPQLFFGGLPEDRLRLQETCRGRSGSKPSQEDKCPEAPKRRLRSSRASKQSLAEPDSATQDPFRLAVRASQAPRNPKGRCRCGGSVASRGHRKPRLEGYCIYALAVLGRRWESALHQRKAWRGACKGHLRALRRCCMLEVSCHDGFRQPARKALKPQSPKA